jgi:translation initiation factor 3 subunit B
MPPQLRKVNKKSSLDVSEAELQAYMSPDDEAAIQDDRKRTEPSPQEEFLAELNKCIVIENLPIVTKDKADKLKAKVEEICRKLEPSGRRPSKMIIQLPANNEGTTLGFAFIAFENDLLTKIAMEGINGLALGKNILQCYPYSNLEKYAKTPEVFIRPERREPPQPIDIESWLEDGREQYVKRFGSETVVEWCDSLALGATSEIVYDGSREKAVGRSWCKMYVQWSPKGSYLLTFHEPGVALWGGPEFLRAPDATSRFAHPRVQNALFSPCERYLVTWDGSDSGMDEMAIKVWIVKSAKVVRGFKCMPDVEWPMLKWSGDGNYLARIVDGGISVYELPSMKLVKKPILAKGIQDFEWSPSTKSHHLAYWSPEEDTNVPARVVILDGVTHEEIRSKNLFNVSTCKLIWSPIRGDFLLAQVLRHSKTGKQTFTNFEIFRMLDNGIPNETLTMTESVADVAFEPPVPSYISNSSPPRFAFIHSGKSGKSIEVSIYSLVAAKGGDKLVKIVTLENKQCNRLIWSPVGGILLLAGTGEINGQLELYDVDENQKIASFEHFMCNEISWDPSGRFLSTAVTQPMFGDVAVRLTLENGFRIWSAIGQKLRDVSQNDFYQFLWRPRPPSLLSDTELEEIRKKLPQHIKRFEKEDALLKRRRQAAQDQKRIQQLEEFRSLMEENHRIFLEQMDKRRKLGIHWSTSDNNETTSPTTGTEEDVTEISEVVEEIISEKVERFDV